MSGMALSWYMFWEKRRWLFILLVFAILAVELFSAQYLEPRESISDTFPQTEKFEKYIEIIEHRGLSSTLYLSLTPKSRQLSTSDWIQTGDQFLADLNSQCKGRLKNVQHRVGKDGLEIYNYIDENLPWLIEGVDYLEIEKNVGADSIRSSVLRNHRKLFTPEGYVLKDMLLRDPLQLNLIATERLKEFSDESIFEIEDDLMFLKKDHSLFLTAELNFFSTDGEQAEALYSDLEELKENWSGDYEVDFFSSVLVGAANSRQVKKDTNLTIWISLSALLVLFSFYYRSLVIPIYFIVSIILGIAFALSILALINREVSGIAVGATAVVLGMMMDYSFHFFTHLRHSTSVQKTIKDVVPPLFIGSLTTVLAFLALSFTDSPVLRDFGVFAALCLIGSAISVSFVIPLFVPSRLLERWKKRKSVSFNFNIGKKIRVTALIAVMAYTVVAAIYASDVKFDDNLFNLGFFPKELRDAEVKFRKIDASNQKKVFILSEAQTKDEVLLADYAVFQKLNDLKSSEAIDGFVCSSIFGVPTNRKEEKLEVWNQFWLLNGSDVPHILDSLEQELDYYENAFDKFEEKIAGDYRPHVDGEAPLILSDFNKLIDSTESGWVGVSYFTVNVDNKEEVVALLNKELINSTVIDRGAMVNDMILSVKSDFNFILLASSLLVFITLIVVYGRIELALITFIPMVISWIWILGTAALLDIRFNMVNIVICTFIFGLGDDFAVFFTDGYLKKYNRNLNVLKSYKMGILLSAGSTLIGLGALIFAKHPALHSISLISILGMISIVVISFSIQPFLLKLFLTGRKERKLPPISLFNLITSILCFSLFIAGCLLTWPIMILFRIIPFGKSSFKLIFHKLIQATSRVNIYTMVNVKKIFHHKERLDFKNPSIIVANHQSFIDVLLMMSLHPKLVIMTNDWVYNSPIFGAQIKYLDFFPGSRGYEEHVKHWKPLVEQGYSIVIFPEGTRSEDKRIKRFHKGAFYLAEKLNLDITPIILHGFNDAMKKDDFFLQNGRINIVVLPRISSYDPQYGETIKERAKSISAYMKREFESFDLKHSDSKYLSHKIISNYVYRSPIIEWYVKVKWRMERKNFDHYHEHVPQDASVLDVGCGFGYLSYYLQLRSNQRRVTGVDYDQGKIEVAENCWSKNDNIRFVCADVFQFDMEQYDVIIMLDVLHYLPKEEQEVFLKKCHNHLNDKGVILIRDGITDLKELHKRTELTERYSTKKLNFNKTVNDLSFFSKDLIVNFASQNKLDLEFHQQKKSSSNSLFILKK